MYSLRTLKIRLGMAVAIAMAAAPLLAGFGGTDLFLPSVGAAPGSGSSYWYTTVWVHNPNSTTATVTFYLLERQANLAPLTFTDSILPGDTVKYDDAIGYMFAKQTFGALRLTSNVKIIAGSRIFSQSGSIRDSVGQFFAGIPAAFAIGVNESTELLGVHATQPSNASDFRYNFGLVETTGTGTCEVLVTAKDDLGNELGSQTYTMAQWQQGQVGFKEAFPSLSTTNARLTVKVVSGGGRVIAFASSVANGSQDPATFEMSYSDDLLGTSSGLDSVFHNATLTGDGTAASPLGIANGGVSQQKLNATGSPTSGYVLGTDGASLKWQSPGSGGGLTAVTHDSTLSGSGTTSSPLSLSAGAVTQGKISASGSASSGKVLGTTGTSLQWQSAGLSLPYSGSGNSSTNVFSVSNSSTTNTSVAVFGSSTSGGGVGGMSTSGFGVFGASSSSSSAGLGGICGTGFGVFGTTDSGAGVAGSSTLTSGYAGYFSGKVRVTGSLSKGSGSFEIDHPLDPAGKYLYHSFVESPDMMNIYNGNVTSDADGLAVVELPEWFEALNQDFRYQLTVIGGGSTWAQARVLSEIQGNRFVVQTSQPTTKVSWQVTGIRHDAYAEANRIQVEVTKPPSEQGYYLHPELFGAPEETRIGLGSLSEEARATLDAQTASVPASN